MEFVARAEPDGYTLLMGNLGMLARQSGAVSEAAVRLRRRTSCRSRAWWSRRWSPSCRRRCPRRRWPSSSRCAKAKPGELNFGSGGNGNINHLAGELFKLQTGTQMQHVPYKGSAPAHVDLAGGRIQLMIDGGNVVQPFVKDGRARALAITGETRSPALPDVPTAEEAGLPTS